MAEEHADAAIALASEHGLVLYRASAAIVKGWALIGRAGGEEPIDQMRKGLTAWQTTGAQLMRPHFLALLAEGVAPAHDDEGLRVLDEALAVAESTGERIYEAELYRLKGERLLTRATRGDNLQMAAGGHAVIDTSSSTLAAAERCFEQAFAVARKQEALSLELRALMSLERLYRERATEETALDRVRSVYSKFTEGFDTLDLRDAKALLDAHSTRARKSD
jgi:predicted ATPase